MSDATGATPARPAGAWDVRASRILNIWAAAWMAALGVLIIVDVTGRALVNRPVTGVPELVAASLVGIAFLQLPYSILSRMMIRTTVLRDAFPASLRKWLDALTALLGFAFFALLAYGSWEPMIESWSNLEYEGSEAFKVPIYPIRAVVMASGLFSAYCYLRIVIASLRDTREFAEPSEA